MIKRTTLVLFLLLGLNAPAQVMSDTIKLEINEHNTIYVTTVLNHKDTLTLNFDTGCTDLIITNEVLKNKLKDSVQLYKTDYPFQIGKSEYTTKIYDAELTGHGTEGRFGWNFFADKTVELNYDRGIMVVHDQLPNVILNDNSYTKLPIIWMVQLPFIEAEISQSGTSFKNYFLFDTGYQRTAMLDNEELQKNGFPIDKMKEIKRIMMRGGQGNEVPVITSELEKISIGKYDLTNVPAQQVIGQKPMRNRNAHILGNEVLKRFNVFMDYENSVIYLKPNNNWNAAYIEAEKN